MHLSVVLLLSLLSLAFSADPTNYALYTEGGIKSGLQANSEHFTLNGKEIRLLSGALHYFRLPAAYWKDRLQKLRAAGLNTVETYIAWNLHEPQEGQFDFQTALPWGLNLVEFIKEAQAADLFVFLRIGPYICAEWEFGGYPYWLLKDSKMSLRSNYKGHLDALGKYYNKVLSLVNPYQFQKGGPIIALQFENEFGGIRNEAQKEYFQYMKDTIDKSGFKELLTNCDSGDTAGSAAPNVLPGVLETDNFNANTMERLNRLKAAQPNKPLMVSEFWPGWFDQWGDKSHHKMTVSNFETEVTNVLFNANASINFYMFFGGTNFAFTAGGVAGGAKVTSYDYNAPLSESGNYTDKYYKTKDLIVKLVADRKLPKYNIPDPPKVEAAEGYGTIKITDYLTFDDLLSKITPKEDTTAKHMELYDQGFGYILYRISHQKFKQLTLTKGVSDRGIIMIDGKEIDTVTGTADHNVVPKDADFGSATDHKVDIFIENMGRVNGGNMNNERRGLNADVTIDGQKAPKYQVFNMDFKESYVNQLKALKGQPYQTGHKQTSPTLYRAQLDIKDKPRDTFIRLDNWTKGIVIVNDYNIGRYYNIGPQKTLYLPAPLLKTGANDIYVFELHSSTDHIQSVAVPDLG